VHGFTTRIETFSCATVDEFAHETGAGFEPFSSRFPWTGCFAVRLLLGTGIGRGRLSATASYAYINPSSGTFVYFVHALIVVVTGHERDPSVLVTKSFDHLTSGSLYVREDLKTGGASADPRSQW
jgi:hypothetical protein